MQLPAKNHTNLLQAFMDLLNDKNVCTVPNKLDPRKKKYGVRQAGKKKQTTQKKRNNKNCFGDMKAATANLPTKSPGTSEDGERSSTKENSSIWKSPTKSDYFRKNALNSPDIKIRLKELENERDRLEDEGKYLDAEVIHEKLVKLKLGVESKRRDSLRANKVSQLQTLEEMYANDLEALKATWDQELKEFEKRVEQGNLELQQKQEEQLIQFREKNTLSNEELLQTRQFPPSRKLLELRKAEKALAKQREYRQANIIKTSADLLEKQEIADRIERLKQLNELAEERLKERFRTEKAVLDQKNNLLRAQLLENRRNEEMNVHNRYQNRKQEMSSATYRVEILMDRRMEHLSPTKTKTKSSIMMQHALASSLDE